MTSLCLLNKIPDVFLICVMHTTGLRLSEKDMRHIDCNLWFKIHDINLCLVDSTVITKRNGWLWLYQKSCGYELLTVEEYEYCCCWLNVEMLTNR